MIVTYDLLEHARKALPKASPEKVDFLVKKLHELSEATRTINEIFVEAYRQLQQEDDMESALYLCDQLAQALNAVSACIFSYPTFTEDTQEEILKIAYRAYKHTRIDLTGFMVQHIVSLKDEKKTPSS